MSSVNSLTAFARSIRRAAAFREVRPVLRTLQLNEEERIAEEHAEDHEEEYTRGDDAANEQTALLNSSEPGAKQDQRSSLTPLGWKLHESASERVEELSQQREETRSKTDEKDREPLLTKTIHRDDGTEAEVNAPRAPIMSELILMIFILFPGDRRSINSPTDHF